VLKEQNAAGKRFRAICMPLVTRPRPGKSSDLYLGFQCFSADTISNFLFSTCFDQMSFPDFQGDIVVGGDIAMPYVTLSKFSIVFIWILRYLPPSILMVLNPSLKGLVVFRTVCLGDFHHAVPYTKSTLGAGNPCQEHFAKPEAVGRCTTSCHIQ
jgi:hypothetical protein